jgi:hypothetical protein
VPFLLKIAPSRAAGQAVSPDEPAREIEQMTADQRTPDCAEPIVTKRLGCGLGLNGVDNFEKGKTVEIGISRANLPDAVFAHEDGCMRVVEQIAGEMWNFSDNLLRDHCMLLRRY